MKINLSKLDINKLINLLQVRELNINVADMYNYYLINENTSITKSSIDRYMSKGKTIEEAFYRSFLDIMELDPKDEELRYVEKTCKINKVTKLDVKKYLNNPYYQNIKVPQVKVNKWNFQYDTFSPYEGFMYKDVTIDNSNYAEINNFGFFTESFKYLTVAQGNEIWMSITPHEIETMEESINEAKGDVVVFGLGLGYYPYMISLKDDVKKITIIERDSNAIKLFKEYILPQFPNKDKIEVIETDAFKYASNMKDHDYAFVDLWHNVDDGLELYLKMKAIEPNVKETTFSYWIEEALLTGLRRCLLVLIDEEADSSDPSNYVNEENYDDHLINKMYQIYKNKVISSYQDIYTLLSKDNLLKLAELIEK